MAYINAEHVAQIRKELKVRFPEYKFGVRKERNSGVRVTVQAGPRDFSDIYKGRTYAQINEYYLDDYLRHATFLKEVVEVIKFGSVNKWFDKSDIMTDYFNTAFYFYIQVGDYDKPYVEKR